MKKIFFLLCLALFFKVNAQFTKLLDFNNTNGTQPFGSVILSANDSVLYGMTNGGGSISNSAGVIYSINTDGSGYSNLHNFTAASTSGSWPYGSIIRSGNLLYGMTSGYGAYGGGTIFSINTNGTGYTTLYDFGQDSADGTNPNGTLAISGNILYGMTYSGGANNNGVIFSINTNGTGYTKLFDFTGTNGQHPGYGALTISGSTMYGTTLYGGTGGVGVLFSIQTNGSGYTKLIDFNNANGSMPFGSVVLSGNVLYGNAGGGLYAKGLIYSIHTDGTGYKDLFDFNGANGQGPMGSFILSGNILYGTTGGGGTNNFGTVFSIDTSGAGFQNLFNFNTPNGTQPRSTLSLAGTMLYGTCVVGGAYGDGTVFKLMTNPPAVPICMVTVDDSSKFNTIVWDKPVTTSIDSFIVYREITTNNYKRIGATQYSALSQFVDTVASLYFPFTGNPNSGTYRYKLQIRDTSGNFSLFSPYHNTIFITQNGGTFNWNQYTIEGDVVPLPSLAAYVLYRDDNSTGTWHAVVGVSGSQTTLTDPNYSSYPNGSWRIETTWNITCTPTAKTTSAYSTSKSNIKTSAPNGIKNQSGPDEINIYPNPATEILNIRGLTGTITVKLSDLIGNIVLEKEINGKSEIFIGNLPVGIYNMTLKNVAETTNKKLVIVR